MDESEATVVKPSFRDMEIVIKVNPPDIDWDALQEVLVGAASRASVVLGRMAEAALWGTATSFTTEQPLEWPLTTWMMPALPDAESVRRQIEQMDNIEVAEQEPRSEREFLELKRARAQVALRAQRRERVKPWEDKGRRFK